jgi:L-iditol 2-dehydrogenase
MVREQTDGRGVDVVLEATDSAAAPGQSTGAACIGGRVILAGIPDTDEVCLRAATLRRKGLTLKAVRRMKHTYPRAIRMVLSGRVRVDRLITHRFTLADAAAAFACHAGREAGVVRVIVEVKD